MKKTLAATILLMCLLFALSACGTAPQTPPASEPTSAPVSEPTPAPAAAPAPETEEPQPTPEAEPTPAAPAFDEEKFNAALALKGQDVALLYEAIGEPLEAYYAPSCMNDAGGTAEDGELIYEGFYVATYRDGGKEIVWDVIRDDG